MWIGHHRENLAAANSLSAHMGPDRSATPPGDQGTAKTCSWISGLKSSIPLLALNYSIKGKKRKQLCLAGRLSPTDGTCAWWKCRVQLPRDLPSSPQRPEIPLLNLPTVTDFIRGHNQIPPLICASVSLLKRRVELNRFSQRTCFDVLPFSADIL